MKEWLLARHESSAADDMEARDEHNEAADAEKSESDDNDASEEDHEDAKIRNFLKKMLEKNNSSWKETARSLSEAVGEEISAKILARITNGYSSFAGPKGKKIGNRISSKKTQGPLLVPLH